MRYRRGFCIICNRYVEDLGTHLETAHGWHFVTPYCGSFMLLAKMNTLSRGINVLGHTWRIVKYGGRSGVTVFEDERGRRIEVRGFSIDKMRHGKDVKPIYNAIYYALKRRR